MWVNYSNNSIVNYMSTKKIFGDRHDYDVNYAALTTANPAAVWFWVVDWATLDTGNTAAQDVMYIEVEYGVRFEGKLSLAQT